MTVMKVIEVIKLKNQIDQRKPRKFSSEKAPAFEVNLIPPSTFLIHMLESNLR